MLQTVLTKWFLKLTCQLLLSCIVVLSSVPLLAVTSEQIEQFKRLSASEQKALAASLGITLPGGSSTASASSFTNTPEVVEPRVLDRSFVATKPQLQPSQQSQQKKQEKTNEEKVAATLKPFGYSLFAGKPSTFAPATDIPMPLDYIIGPGDAVIVQLYGKENRTHELVVNREGVLHFPAVGPLSVNGLNFGELKTRLQELVAEQMIGIKVSVTMGKLRSIRVFVLGEAYRPGSYTVSALSTLTNALFVSGGVNPVGSLRSIQLKRKGQLVTTLDLYDLLLKGDTSKDARLQPGDVLFIPPVGRTVAVSGEIKRPAIYELKNEQTAEQLIEVAGGYLPTAYPKASRIERIDQRGNRTVLDLNLLTPRGKNKKLADGDHMKVYSVLDKLENVVVVKGHVHRPGYFKWRKGLRVSDVIGALSDLNVNPDLRVALIKHERGPERLLAFEWFHLGRALKQPGSVADRVLSPRDEIIVFAAGDKNRSVHLADYLKQLEQQAKLHEYPKLVKIFGHVKSAGVYPLAQAMTAQALVKLAGGLKPETQMDIAVLARREPSTGRYSFQVVQLLERVKSKERLRPFDELYVLGSSQSSAELFVDLLGEVRRYSRQGEVSPIVSVSGAVRYQGEYPYTEKARVRDLIAMAGGLKEEAYLLSGELTRRRIDDEQEFGITHINLVLDEQQGLSMNMELKPRDQLLIKRIPNWNEQREIEVSGEVRFPGRYPISNGETLSQVLARAGGVTEQADLKGAIFLRDSLKEKEAKVLKGLRKQLKEEVSRLEQQILAANAEQAEQRLQGKKLLNELETTEALGRLVVDLPGLLEKGNLALDVVLRHGDQIIVPPVLQEVSIVGEVQFPSSHLYVKNLNGKDYLQKGGGATRYGDQKRAYIIGRDGNVMPLLKNRFFLVKAYNRVLPGDTIVVPRYVDKLSPLVYWTKISEIVFQLATTAAALETVGAI